jgi:hypothetical protein
MRGGFLQKEVHLAIPPDVWQWEHRTAEAVMHDGHHQHSAKEMESGERYNLLLWFDVRPLMVCGEIHY